MPTVPFRALTMRHLRCFTVLVEERNFSRAAGRLSISQPALSSAIKQLELTIGAQLLLRSTHRLELTLAGAQLLERADYLVNVFDLTLLDVDNLLHRGRALVRVGTVPSASGLLASCIEQYSAQISPALEVRLTDGLADALLAQTRAGELDVAVAAVTDAPAGLTSVALFDDPIVLVVPRGHPLAARSSTTWRTLGDERLVMFAIGSMPALGEMARTQFGDGGPEPFKVNYLETMCSMVRTRMALGLVPRLYAMSIMDPSLVAVRLSRPGMHRTVSLLYRSGAKRHAHVGRFIDFLEARLPRGLAKHS